MIFSRRCGNDEDRSIPGCGAQRILITAGAENRIRLKDSGDLLGLSFGSAGSDHFSLGFFGLHAVFFIDLSLTVFHSSPVKVNY